MRHPKNLKSLLKTSCGGFSLAELLGVMAVIAILAGLILGVAGFAGRKVSEAACISELEQWRNLLEDFKEEYGYYPPRNMETVTSMWTNLVDVSFWATNSYYDSYVEVIDGTAIGLQSLYVLTTNNITGGSDGFGEFKDYVDSFEDSPDYEDPWGNDYAYQKQSVSKYRIGSTGPNGMIGDTTEQFPPSRENPWRDENNRNREIRTEDNQRQREPWQVAWTDAAQAAGAFGQSDDITNTNGRMR